MMSSGHENLLVDHRNTWCEATSLLIFMIMSLTVRALFWFLIVSVTSSLVFEGWRRRSIEKPSAFHEHDDPGDPSSLVTFRRSRIDLEYRVLDSVRVPWNGDEKPGVAAIILNWSRFRNVVLIVSGLCDPRLQAVIAEIVVWNNNPRRKISTEVSSGFERFTTLTTPRGLTVHGRQEFDVSCGSRLRIVNSPENLYFQARYMACSNSTAKYCFIQVRRILSPMAGGVKDTSQAYDSSPG